MADSLSAVELKTSLAVENKLEIIFSGGRIQDTELVMCLALSPDGKQLCVTSRSLQIKLYEWPSATCVRSFKAHEGPVVALDYDTSSTLLATGSSDSTVKVWDTQKFYCTHSFRGCQGVVSVVRFLPVKKVFHLFAAAEDGNIRAWNLEDSKPVCVLSSHTSVVRGLEFSLDGSMLYSVARDKVLNIWDLSKQAVKNTIPLYEPLEGLALLPAATEFPGKDPKAKTQYIATAGEKGILRILSAATGKIVYEQPASSTSKSITGVYFNHAAGQLITTSIEQTINFWALAADAVSPHKQIVGSYDDIIDIKFAGENDALLVVATNSEDLQIIDRSSLNTYFLSGHTEIVLAIDVSLDGKQLVSSSKDRTVRVWEHTADGFVCTAVGIGHTEAIGAVALAPGKQPYVVSGSKDTTLKLWALPAVDGQLHAKYTRAAHTKDINAVAVAPNGKIVATASQDRTAKLWRAIDGHPLRTLSGHRRGVWAVQFSPVDQVLATGSADATVRIWSVGDGVCLRTLEGHMHSVLRVAFVSRGMQLVTSGSDGLLKLWTVRTSEVVATFDEHTDKVWALAVSRDEQHVASGGADSCIVLYRDDSSEKKQAEVDQLKLQVEMEQQLANHLHGKRFREAVRVALALKQPFRLLGIFRNLLLTETEVALDVVLGELTPTELGDLLGYVRDWNTNSRHSFIAQSVLSVLLKTSQPATLAAVPNIKAIIDGLQPYTERHFARMDRLVAQSYLLDYTCASMHILPAAALTIAAPLVVEIDGVAATKGIDMDAASPTLEAAAKDGEAAMETDGAQLDGNGEGDGGEGAALEEDAQLVKKKKRTKPQPKSATPAKKAKAAAKETPETATPGKTAKATAKETPETATSGKKAKAAAKETPKTATPGKTATPRSKAKAAVKETPETATPGSKAKATAKETPKTATSGKKAKAAAKETPETATPGRKAKAKETPQQNGTAKKRRMSAPDA